MKIDIYKNSQILILFLHILILNCFGFSQTAEEFFKRGKEYQGKREYDLARTDFSQAIKLNPDYAEAFFERGRTDQMKSRSGCETCDFDQAIYRSPNVANYYYHRGLSYHVKSKYNEAIADFTKAIALAPDKYEGYRVRFEAYRKIRDFDKALKDINKAIELEPNGLAFYFGRGVLFLAMDDCAPTEKAVDDFSTIIAGNPNFPIVYDVRAKGYKKLAECAQRIADNYLQVAEKEKQKLSEIQGTFLNSRAKTLARPLYPKGINIDQTVHVKVTVSGDGSVKTAEMMYGDLGFKKSVEDAALATKFPPTIIDGKPIETWGTLVFNMTPPVSGRGNGTGDGYSRDPYGYFATENLELRRYLPGDTQKLGGNPTYLLGELDLPTTNPAILFSPITPNSSTVESQKGELNPIKILSKPIPAYTVEARTNQVMGVVKLRVTFLSNGSIGGISVVSGLPAGLTEQAIAAARSIRFIPANRNGVPKTVTNMVEFSFTLK